MNLLAVATGLSFFFGLVGFTASLLLASRPFYRSQRKYAVIRWLDGKQPHLVFIAIVGWSFWFGANVWKERLVEQDRKEVANEIKTMLAGTRHDSGSVGQRASPDGRHTDFTRLVTLATAANPGYSSGDVRKFSGAVLMIREFINLCKSEEPTAIRHDQLLLRLSADGALVTLAELDELSRMMTAERNEPDGVGSQLSFLKVPESDREMVIDCHALTEWLETAAGLEIMTILSRIRRERHLSFYERAVALYSTLQEAEQLPPGQERATTMTIAMQNKWDVLIREFLDDYLKNEPNGAHAKDARMLLSEVERSELLKAMAGLRSALVGKTNRR